jgi:hypothetical protein
MCHLKARLVGYLNMSSLEGELEANAQAFDALLNGLRPWTLSTNIRYFETAVQK